VAIAVDEVVKGRIQGEGYDVTRGIKALDRLKKLEVSFDRFLKTHEERTPADKKEFLKEYVSTARKHGLELNLENEELLDALHDLILIFDFLYQEAGLMVPFNGDEFPISVTDLLLGDVGDAPIFGACKPMTTLAVHLGRRINLSIDFYRTDQHVNARVEAGGELFLFDPTAVFQLTQTGETMTKGATESPLFIPASLFVRDFRAPNTKATPDLEVFIGQSFTYPAVLVDQGRLSLADLRPYHELRVSLFPEDANGHMALAAHYTTEGMHEKALAEIDRSLELYADSFRASVTKSLILINLKRYEDAYPSVQKCYALLSELIDRMKREELVLPPALDSLVNYYYSYGLVHEQTDRPDVARGSYYLVLQQNLPEEHQIRKRAISGFKRTSQTLIDYHKGQGDLETAAAILSESRQILGI
jgi:tetratricopeptide (TPR) repeat protein